MLTSQGYATGKGRHSASPPSQPASVKATLPTKPPIKPSLHSAGGRPMPTKGTGPC